ncbi:MAG TPA: hypothetical protein ENI27_09195 [bacterium]|nr:hypothetical protein [bacterium]
MNLSDLTGMFEGRKVWVLGNGPSLDDVNLFSIHRDRCIGVNRILRPGGRNENILRSGWAPGFIVFQDVQVWTGVPRRDEGEKERMLQSGSTLIISKHLLDDSSKLELPLSRCITFEKEKKSVKKVLSGKLCECYLTGTVAAQIAARMVYPGGTVVLCGMDLRYPKDKNQKDHFYGSGKRIGCRLDRGKEAAKFITSLKNSLVGKVDFVVVGESLLDFT